MNKVYIAKEGERLDKVVYNHYGNLEYFNAVLEVNPKLTPLLKNGDKVIFPKIEIKENKEVALW
ncbi:tail protein X [Helicobacter winghamensis]|uniref:Phage tail protein n=1 Tax=Helicobacter winghamensis TaxID=157268 RepID=A0A2N3PK14_9HELI|nr:tail protein X [Helicobacter winghamensis]EEO26019.1 phage Tail Protein X [Helicobacter winghamensis ATCC BAA-430]PKT77953.1 phage tail protein [Helicobacter winghamensis]PKT78777.1 phage tail protein [Helicobacter winghamensis]PKT78811.1 phage tail protein [Helicobacter winghamensis]PKT81751.1 phage tail protein [Helicobacter winghamensis]